MLGAWHAPHTGHGRALYLRLTAHAVYLTHLIPIVVPATHRAKEPDSTMTSRGRSGVRNGEERTR